MIIRLDSKTLAVRHGRLAFARMAVAPIFAYVCYVNYCGWDMLRCDDVGVIGLGD